MSTSTRGSAENDRSDAAPEPVDFSKPEFTRGAYSPREASRADGDAENGRVAHCVFCAIAVGDSPAHEVFRDDDFVAFLDAHPVFHGHVLMVPTTHVQTYDELSEKLATPWLRLSQRLVRAVEGAMDADGSLLIVNNVVSQSVPHLHLHVIPRSRGDGLRFWLGPRHKYTSDAEANAIAARIRTALAAAPAG
ncbi:HIT family protein [Humibacter ginsenosidimutans]|uniref:HIT family protein n=1 Tax=Humibacter ginsenosidimutans TaxID=2599293 RepID=A0A5B8M899_9MICO|nr:HIT family protein [Humibacter ginsenosidimutans]